MASSDTKVRRCGYTLAEVMIAGSLMVVLAAISVTGLLFIQRSGLALRHHTELQTVADRTLTQLEVDIQNGVSVEAIDPMEVKLSTVRGDADIREVRYWIDLRQSALFRQEGEGAPRLLMEDLSEGRFSFWTASEETDEKSEVRRIGFESVVSRDVGGRFVIRKTVSASFILRNLHYAAEVAYAH